jgi:hypothetical protein
VRWGVLAFLVVAVVAWRIGTGINDGVVPSVVNRSGCEAAQLLVARDLRYTYNGQSEPLNSYTPPDTNADADCAHGFVVSQRPAAGTHTGDGAVVYFEVECSANVGCWVGDDTPMFPPWSHGLA